MISCASNYPKTVPAAMPHRNQHFQQPPGILRARVLCRPLSARTETSAVRSRVQFKTHLTHIDLEANDANATRGEQSVHGNAAFRDSDRQHSWAGCP
jgi:hypothetical protein